MRLPCEQRTRPVLHIVVKFMCAELRHTNRHLEGVWELRIDAGPSYRVYYARSGKQVVLLLCGGDKRTQDADISRACEHWQDWQRRSSDEG
jgi:putative addiction module killer protein